MLDRHGRSVAGLGPRDIVLTDSGRQITDFTSFIASSDLPLRLGLLLDPSNPMRKGFAGEQQAAGDFLQPLLRSGVHVGFVFGFSPTGVRKRTEEGKPVMLSLVRSFTPDGQTSLDDAICQAWW